MSKIEVNQISSQCGSTLTIGQSGDTVTLACGATQSGFGRSGSVNWDTTAKTAGFTAVSGNGYFVNTTSGAITVTLPATPSAGDIVSISDYANTSVTNNITVARNGSNIEGSASDLTIENNGIALTFIYVDGTRGWKVVNAGKEADKSNVTYMTATGGTETTCGDYKIHTFTGPGTFCVSCAGDIGTVDYLVVAGGGAGGLDLAGGGGAGGMRFSATTYCAPCTSAPRAGSVVPVTVQGYPIAVGGGGTGFAPACRVTNDPGTLSQGNNGSNSIFSTITSTGGGGGGSYNNGDSNPLQAAATPGKPGGSGGGQGVDSFSPGTANNPAAPIGAGNTPPVSPSQGNDGGIGTNSPWHAAGGGGAGAVGANATPGPACNPGGKAGDGGVGLQIGISGTDTYYAGGGGGAAFGTSNNAAAPQRSVGGLGGGGAGGYSCFPTRFNGVAGTANTGGGAGGSAFGPSNSTGGGGNGGSGIVIIRYKYQ